MSRSRSRQPLWTMGGLVMLALLLQQVLLRQPPRLLQLSQAPASSGPAALRLRFSRPMDPASLSASRLDPPLAHRWLGDGDTFLLTLAPGQRLQGPLRLTLAGSDLSRVPLQPSRWLWDPRPRLLAVVPVGGGDQLQLRDHDGRWSPLVSRVWPQILAAEALGDGSALALVSREGEGFQRVWRVPLRQRNLAREELGLGPVQAAAPEALLREPLLFAQISGNRRGELLVQADGIGGQAPLTQLWPAEGFPRSLVLDAVGTANLLPEGGAVVVPRNEGLTLENLPPRPPRRQILPGSRDLLAFCPRSGRALLRRHWPDYRRSLEWLEPGQPPRELWRGSEALLAATCQGGGERIWLALLGGERQPQLSLLSLNRQRQVSRRLTLDGWELEPGTELLEDPTTEQLVAALRPFSPGGQGGKQRPVPSRPMRLPTGKSNIPPEPLGPPVRQVLWLPPGAVVSQ